MGIYMKKIFNWPKSHLSDDGLVNDEETVNNGIDKAVSGYKTDTESKSLDNADELYDDEKAYTDKDDNEAMGGLSEDDMSLEESRRAYRRKRRIRNQIIAYGVVALFLIALLASGIAAGRKISSIINKGKQDDEILAEQETEQDADLDGDIDKEPEEIVIGTPPEPEVEENTVDEQLEEIVNNCIAVMPLEDKVAGLFVITPEALTKVRNVVRAGEGTQEALNNYAVGGLIYFDNNIVDKDQLSEMLSNTVSMSKYPIFLAVDEEGGEVSRIANSQIEVVKVDDVQTIGKTGDTTAAYEAGVTIGSYLDELGFNLDFAPVADVITGTGHASLVSRTFGTDPELCADMVSSMVNGIQGASVSACLKHFPGIGSSREDTHDGRVEITKTLDEMRNSDFLPFQAGIAAGVDIIMVSHATASAVDTEGVPSSLSKTMITDVLRNDLGYDGVVITDALNMGAISNYYTSDEAAVNAIMAGADMLLMPENFNVAYEGLLAAVREGRISEERIDESLRRIYRIKYADKLE